MEEKNKAEDSNEYEITFVPSWTKEKPQQKEANQKIVELTEEEAKNYKSMGKGYGVGLGLCFYYAHKYCKNFEDRCIGYRILGKDKVASIFSNATGKEYISVEFYEKSEK